MKSRSHDDAVIEMLRNDPDFAAAYLHAAFEEMDEEEEKRPFSRRYATLSRPEAYDTTGRENRPVPRESVPLSLAQGQSDPAYHETGHPCDRSEVFGYRLGHLPARPAVITLPAHSWHEYK